MLDGFHISRGVEMASSLPCVRVVVAADDPLVRASLLSRLPPGSVIDAIQTDALRGSIVDGADVVLWDVGPDGGQLARHIDNFAWTRLPIVALSSDATAGSRLLSGGASAVLAREIGPAALLSAIEGVTRGLVILDHGAAAHVREAITREAEVKPGANDAEFSALTTREREVLSALAEGCSNKEIAERLKISSHTAKFHVNAILAKLGASTRTEAAVRAIARGWVSA